MAALTAAVAVAVAAPQVHASVPRPRGLPVGPTQISPLGHPRLCWQAWGNGSPVTLARCDAARQGQEWTFTGNGVLMNGNGYCLQHGGSAGSPSAGSLYLSFSGQCAGSASQDWPFASATDSIENPPAHLCASASRDEVPAGPPVAGATITARRCSGTRYWSAWSQGTSDLTLSRAARPAATARPRPGAQGTRTGPGQGRGFSASVTVSNAPKAMTAYAASVALRLPAGLTATRLVGTGALTGWACTVRRLTCHGTLPGGSAGSITVSGRLSSRPGVPGRSAVPGQSGAPGQSGVPGRNQVIARATVAGTNQAPHARVTATVPLRKYALSSTGKAAANGAPSGSITIFAVIVAILVLTGALFLWWSRRRPHPSRYTPRHTHCRSS